MDHKLKSVLAFSAGIVLVVAACAFGSAQGQKEEKAWTDWSKKEAEKILANSPWSHMQVETNTSEMFYSPTADPRTSGRTPANDGSRLEQGATNQSIDVKYGIRLLSARPVRQAFIRMMQLQQTEVPEATAQRLRAFAEAEWTSSIIVAVTFESKDGRSSGKAMQAFNSANTGILKNNTYLERSSDGKRLFLEEYVPPSKDGFGARFIFLRTLDEQPFVTPQAGAIRFYSEVPGNPKLNVSFKVSEMMYNGQLEY